MLSAGSADSVPIRHLPSRHCALHSTGRIIGRREKWVNSRFLGTQRVFRKIHDRRFRTFQF
jgi:hypothetical protein